MPLIGFTIDFLRFSGLMTHGKRRCKKARSSGATRTAATGCSGTQAWPTRLEIAEEVGLSYTAVSKIIARFEAQGMASLVPRKRGRRSGRDHALTPEQEARIQRLICDTCRGQLKMDFALWSCPAVMQLENPQQENMHL